MNPNLLGPRPQFALHVADAERSANGGNARKDRVVILACQPEESDRVRVQGFVFEGPRRTDDHVAGAQILDLLLDPQANAFADRQQPNDAGDADENPQHGQQRPQRMHQQTLESRLPD